MSKARNRFIQLIPSLLLTLLTGLLLAACGDSTATSFPVVTTASATSVAATAAATTATATSAASSPTIAASPAASSTAAPLTTSAATGPVKGDLIVFAASSLTDSFKEIKVEWEKANPDSRLTFNFGGSPTLRTQIEQGAKADVFASADTVQMEQALQSGVVTDKGTIFVTNRLVVILPKNNPAKIAKLSDLAKPGVKFVTTQKDVPVGNYTGQILEKLNQNSAYGPDFAAKVNANTVSRETNVKQVVSKVQLGEADAGIVYTSDITPNVKADLVSLDIPDPYNVVASYPASVVKDTQAPEAAQRFIAFLRSAKAQAIFQKYNFGAAVAS
ncbi:MAG TPA: molybdate ABC transporter substrate-binding protein [Chloroflexia bacterium]|nr:molybdate ABC transporter substrate-binding protein [Chloroflexia bacterium]